MMFMYYTIFTIGKQTWGGVRVDRAKQAEAPELTEVVVEEGVSVTEKSVSTE
jgi:hypothetical protein